jgi:hypothetical protein
VGFRSPDEGAEPAKLAEFRDYVRTISTITLCRAESKIAALQLACYPLSKTYELDPAALNLRTHADLRGMAGEVVLWCVKFQGDPRHAPSWWRENAL